VKQAAQNV